MLAKLSRCGRRRCVAGAGPHASRRDRVRGAAATQELFDLVDPLAGVPVADVDQGSRVGGVEEEIAHQVGTLRVGRAEALHQVTHQARHAVGEALRHHRQVLGRAHDERCDVAHRVARRRAAAGGLA
jgi:hypothetical protein